MHRGTPLANGSPERDLAEETVRHGAAAVAPALRAYERMSTVREGVPVAGALAAPSPPPPPRTDHAEPVPFYYSSKYARLDALPRALDYGQVECLTAVRTYIGYVFDPPDGEGDPVENALHLRAACARLRTGTRSDNAALLLLEAFSLLVVEAASMSPAASVDLTAANATLRNAVAQVRTAYRQFMESDPWPELLAVLTVFSDRLTDLAPSLEPLLAGLHQECVVYRTVRLLRGFNRRLLDDPLP